MTTIEARKYEMLVRVHEFGERHGSLFPTTSVGAKAFATVAAAVTQLGDQAVSRLLSAREGKSTKAMAREALVDRLESIRRTATVLAEDVPGLDDAFKRPRSQPDQGILATARAFAHDAEAYKSQFVEHGMAATFIADLNGLIEGFAQAIRDRETGRGGYTAARASIHAAMSSAWAAVRKLDVIVANQLRDDPVTLAVWEHSRRVEYPHRARRGAPPAVAPPPTVDPAQPGDTGLERRVPS